MSGRSFAVLLLAGLCAGCAVGPDYVRPKLDAPPAWGEAREPARPAADFDRTAWWESFGDPVLNDLVRQAVANNLDVKIARERITEARASLTGAKAGFWPSVSAAGSFSRTRTSTTLDASGDISTDTTASLFTAGFDASWELDVFGGTRRKVESAWAGLEATRESLNDTLLTLLGDVATNYIELRSGQAQLAVTRDNLKAQAQTVAVTRERVRLGLTTELDAVQAEAQRLSTESDLPTIEAAIAKSIHRLGVLLGREPGALKESLHVLAPLPRSSGLAATGLPAELLTRRPDLRRLERKLAGASADIGAATADLYPKFDLTLGLGLSSALASKLVSLPSGYWSAVPGVSQLLFDAGKTRATVAAKRSAYEQARLEYQGAFLTALEDVENSLCEYAAEQRRVTTLEAAVRADTEAVALAEERYARGLITFLDVLVSQKALYTAQSSLRKSEASELIALVSLYKALGGGWRTVGGEDAGS